MARAQRAEGAMDGMAKSTEYLKVQDVQENEDGTATVMFESPISDKVKAAVKAKYGMKRFSVAKFRLFVIEALREYIANANKFPR